jgi:hypothetical protein
MCVVAINITLTIHVSHPDIVTGDARNALYNSIAQSFEVLGPEWTHRFSHATDGRLIVHFERNSDAPMKILSSGSMRTIEDRLQGCPMADAAAG